MFRLKSFAIRSPENRKKNVEVIFEDDHLLVINKPSGLLAVPDHWDAGKPNLVNLLQDRYSKLSGNTAQAIWVVHRIDADTSGIIIFARNPQMHRSLCMQFENGQIKKTYLAVVCGAPDPLEGEIDLPIQKHPIRKSLMQTHSKGKPSLTNYKTIEKFKSYSLLELTPKTGRTHQIRVHMQAINCPLAIDPRYGNSTPITISQLKYRHSPKNLNPRQNGIINRLTLHAYKIEFNDPLNGEKRIYEAPLPKDFLALLKSLRRWGA